MDLPELEPQPILSFDENVTVTYNGEIYNYRELRVELKETGDYYKSECDTEVLIAAYREWGCDYFKSFNGIFAAAIYDKAESFSIGFHEKERNEAEFAAAIARHIGTRHKELYIGEKEILEMIADLQKYYDEPFSDSSKLPTMLVSNIVTPKYPPF